MENQVKEVVLRSGNSVSTGALSSLGFWGVDVVVETHRGRPVAMMKAFDDDSHVETRLAQYEAVHSEKRNNIAKEIVLGRIKTQNIVLEKYGLVTHDLDKVVKKIDSLVESRQENLINKLRALLQLVPERIRPLKRRKYRAYEGVNNLFNLGFEVLQWKVHRALVRAYLEPYLGFLHSVSSGKPSLVCDMEELYRYKIENFELSMFRI